MLQYRVSITSAAGSYLCVWLACASAGAATFKTIYNFAGGSDGANSQAALTVGPGGMLYGTTTVGGNIQACSGVGCGPACALTRPASSGGAWTKTILWVFGGAGDGVVPLSLTLGGGGVLYGVTEGGGTGACAGG